MKLIEDLKHLEKPEDYANISKKMVFPIVVCMVVSGYLVSFRQAEDDPSMLISLLSFLGIFMRGVGYVLIALFMLSIVIYFYKREVK